MNHSWGSVAKNSHGESTFRLLRRSNILDLTCCVSVFHKNYITRTLRECVHVRRTCITSLASASRHRYLDPLWIYCFNIFYTLIDSMWLFMSRFITARGRTASARNALAGTTRVSRRKPNLPCLCTRVMIAHARFKYTIVSFCSTCFFLLLLFITGWSRKRHVTVPLVYHLARVQRFAWIKVNKRQASREHRCDYRFQKIGHQKKIRIRGSTLS